VRRKVQMSIGKPVRVGLAVLGGCGLLLFSPVNKGGMGEARAAGETEPPVNITADRMEYRSEEGIVIFSGNALAVRGDVTLSAEKMKVTLSEGGEKDEGSVSRIVAKGDVNFRQTDLETGKERFATGERGEYDAEGRLVTLTGDPRVWEGKNIITGDKMVFYLDENRFIVEGRVGLEIYPEEGQEPQ
jgi:lipopolysaccharide export system protein LptA